MEKLSELQSVLHQIIDILEKAELAIESHVEFHKSVPTRSPAAIAEETNRQIAGRYNAIRKQVDDLQ